MEKIYDMMEKVMQKNPAKIAETLEKTYQMSQEYLKSYIEKELYEEVYGNHFTEEKAYEAVSCMANEDGTVGEHWSLAETTDVAKANGITFDTFNEYDWYYTLNMIYSDYFKEGEDATYYLNLAKQFLMDKDFSKNGKAYLYYMLTK